MHGVFGRTLEKIALVVAFARWNMHLARKMLERTVCPINHGCIPVFFTLTLEDAANQCYMMLLCHRAKKSGRFAFRECFSILHPCFITACREIRQKCEFWQANQTCPTFRRLVNQFGIESCCALDVARPMTLTEG